MTIRPKTIDTNHQPNTSPPGSTQTQIKSQTGSHERIKDRPICTSPPRDDSDQLNHRGMTTLPKPIDTNPENSQQITPPGSNPPQGTNLLGSTDPVIDRPLNTGPPITVLDQLPQIVLTKPTPHLTRITGPYRLGPRPKNVGRTKLTRYHFRASAYQIYGNIPHEITLLKSKEKFKKWIKRFQKSKTDIPKIPQKAIPQNSRI